MHYRFEPAAGFLIRKYESAHCGTVERSIRVNHRFAESVSDLCESRLARHYNFAGDDIGIDDACTELGE